MRNALIGNGCLRKHGQPAALRDKSNVPLLGATVYIYNYNEKHLDKRIGFLCLESREKSNHKRCHESVCSAISIQLHYVEVESPMHERCNNIISFEYIVGSKIAISQ